MSMLARVPRLRQIWPVYAVVVLMIYSWTLLWFFWKLSGWLIYLRLDEILTIFAYSSAVNFIESLIVLLGLVAVSVILPQKWFYDHFVTRGTILVLVGLGYLMYVASRMQTIDGFPESLILRFTIPVILLAVLVILAADRFAALRSVFEELANRATIFLYIFLPISLVSLLVVIFRNLV